VLYSSSYSSYFLVARALKLLPAIDAHKTERMGTKKIIFSIEG
jgi:hypothetical protein